jgi:hypothetical protein
VDHSDDGRIPVDLYQPRYDVRVRHHPARSDAARIIILQPQVLERTAPARKPSPDSLPRNGPDVFLVFLQHAAGDAGQQNDHIPKRLLRHECLRPDRLRPPYSKNGVGCVPFSSFITATSERRFRWQLRGMDVTLHVAEHTPVGGALSPSDNCDIAAARLLLQGVQDVTSPYNSR